MDELWQSFRDPLREYAGHALGAAVLLFLGWLALRLLIGPLQRLLGRGRMDPLVASFLTSTARSAVVVVVFIAVLNQVGVQTASLLTLLGVAGAAIALSLQGSLTNFASGLILLTYRLVRVGDSIEFGDIRGRVTEMLPFHIVLVTPDNQRHHRAEFLACQRDSATTCQRCPGGAGAVDAAVEPAGRYLCRQGGAQGPIGGGHAGLAGQGAASLRSGMDHR